jgi:hypothetical protein
MQNAAVLPLLPSTSLPVLLQAGLATPCILERGQKMRQLNLGFSSSLLHPDLDPFMVPLSASVDFVLWFG